MKKMSRNTSKKSHSWWWNSHISPKNSKWLAENLEKMDGLVKEMLMLIEEEGDSFARKAEMYYKRRPELIKHVEEFYRMYRALAERYDHVTGELRSTVSSELNSQGSNVSDVSSEPPSPSQSPLFDTTPEHKAPRPKSAKAAGFDFFLGSGGSSDVSKRGSDSSSSSSGSNSEPDEPQESCGDVSTVLRQRVIELENELHRVKEKLGEYEASNHRCEHLENSVFEDFRSKISSLEEELVISDKKLRSREEEVLELQKRLEEGSLPSKAESVHEDSGRAHASELEEKVSILESGVLQHKRELDDLKVALAEAAKKHEAIICSRDQTIEDYKNKLSCVTETYSKEKSSLEASAANLDISIQRLKEEVRVISEEKQLLQARILEQEHLIEEIRSKATADADRFSVEKSELEARILSLSQSHSSLEMKLKSFESTVMHLETEKTDLNRNLETLSLKYTALEGEKEKLSIQINVLADEIKARDDRLSQIALHLHRLHLEHMKLIKEMEEAQKAGNVLKARVKDLEDEVERQRTMVLDGAEEKREAIRQLCFSLQHYRDGYQQLREALLKHKRLAVAAIAAAS